MMKPTWMLLILAAAGFVARASDVMPASQQNELIAKYCAVCHTDKARNGGLSLEHFDAAHADPGEAAMIVSKLKAKALGASGQKLPDKATQDALFNAMVAESAGFEKWTTTRAQHAPVMTASIVREVASKDNDGDPDLYRLTLTCNTANRQGEMMVAWSPATPHKGQEISIAADSKAPVKMKLDQTETMGNG